MGVFGHHTDIVAYCPKGDNKWIFTKVSSRTFQKYEIEFIRILYKSRRLLKKILSAQRYGSFSGFCNDKLIKTPIEKKDIQLPKTLLETRIHAAIHFIFYIYWISHDGKIWITRQHGRDIYLKRNRKSGLYELFHKIYDDNDDVFKHVKCAELTPNQKAKFSKEIRHHMRDKYALCISDEFKEQLLNEGIISYGDACEYQCEIEYVN